MYNLLWWQPFNLCCPVHNSNLTCWLYVSDEANWNIQHRLMHIVMLTFTTTHPSTHPGPSWRIHMWRVCWRYWRRQRCRASVVLAPWRQPGPRWSLFWRRRAKPIRQSGLSSLPTVVKCWRASQSSRLSRESR